MSIFIVELCEVSFEIELHRVDLMYEQADDLVDDPWVRELEAQGVPVRELMSGRVNVNHFHLSSDLRLLIESTELFVLQTENWTRGRNRYKRMKNFTINVFNLLMCIKRDTDWRTGGKPPIDRNTYKRLVVTYKFKPFRKHWSSLQKIHAKRYAETIKVYYKTVNTESHEEMKRQIDDNDDFIYTEVIS